MTTPTLHPEHLADLRKSGLTDDTIAACAIEAVRPHDIKLDGVLSAYRLPYFNIDRSRNCFERRRLFPPIITKDGHTQKYWQPAHTAPELYLPPLLSWKSAASNAACTLVIAEGEKKAACACERGLICSGLGGVWNWRAKLDTGEPLILPTLDQFVWKDREVELVPDSDAWRPEKALDICAGFYALAQELVSRGASVRLVRLPDLQGAKNGLDDWLVSVGAEWEHLWPKLERVTLDDPSLKPLACWWQRWRSRQAETEAARTRAADQPEVQRIGGVLQFDWPAYRVRCVLDCIKDAQDKVTAEFSASLTSGDTSIIPLLTSTTINLKTLRARGDFAKKLVEKQQGIPWQQIVETVCQRALAVLREGEPLQRLAKDVVVEPLTYQLNPLVYAKRPTILYGDGGLLKSYVALLAGMCVDTGASVAGLQGARGRVLYIDYEAEHADHVHRLKRLCAAHPDLSSADLQYRRCAFPLSQIASQLHRLIAEHRVALLIIDSLAMACGGKPQDSDTAIHFFGVLRQLPCATLTIAHVPKNPEEGTSIFGSVFFKNIARSTWEIRKVHDTGAKDLRLGLFNAKFNLDGGHRPIGFEVSFQDEATTRSPPWTNWPRIPSEPVTCPLTSRPNCSLKWPASKHPSSAVSWMARCTIDPVRPRRKRTACLRSRERPHNWE